MAQPYRLSSVLLLTAALAGAEAMSPDCFWEVETLHGVWHTGHTYLPIYADTRTFAYLAALGIRASATGRAILPVYAADPIHFGQGNYIFVSTGLILAARDEQALVDAIRVEIGRRPRPPQNWISSCAAPHPPEGGTLQETQSRISRQVAEYQDEVTPRLKRR